MVPRSPYLAACDLFGVGHFKFKVVLSQSATMQVSKAKIQEAIAEFLVQMLCWTINILTKRIQECLSRNGAHLQDIIFKSTVFILKWHYFYF